MVMQRYLSAKSPSTAKRGLWINAAVSVVSLSLLILFGLALVIYAREHDFPAASNPIQILASMLKSFPPGSAGMIAAGLFAATMSSIDSGLNSCSAALVTDFRERFHLPEISPKTMTALLAVPVISAAGFLLPALNRTQTLFTILNKIVNTIGTPLLAVMICAIFCKKTHAAAVFAGTLAGTVITVFISCFIENLALHYYAV